jgi:hypothetical protein
LQIDDTSFIKNKGILDESSDKTQLCVSYSTLSDAELLLNNGFIDNFSFSPADVNSSIVDIIDEERPKIF